MKRRSFVQALAAGSLSLPRGLSSLYATSTSAAGSTDSRTDAAARVARPGIELYAVRNAMKKDPERTLAALRAIGYTQVELLWSFGNFGRTPQQVRDTLRKEGLRAPSCHMAPETITKDWPKALDDAATIGQQYLIVPSLPNENGSLDTWKIWADRFNEAGAVARKHGLWLAFHNEPNHQNPIDDNIPYDLFIRRTDPSVVRLQLDVGNMLMGGGDPVQYYNRFSDRYFSFHLKDVTPDRKHDTELGKGMFDFKSFLAMIPALDTKPCYVEMESPKDELESARMNYEYLRALNLPAR